MRISDWSSDVCSSDLTGPAAAAASNPSLFSILQSKKADIESALLFCGGEGGIPTPGTFSRTPDFESGTFNHSATSPWTCLACGSALQVAAGLCAARLNLLC